MSFVEVFFFPCHVSPEILIFFIKVRYLLNFGGIFRMSDHPLDIHSHAPKKIIPAFHSPTLCGTLVHPTGTRAHVPILKFRDFLVAQRSHKKIRSTGTREHVPILTFRNFRSMQGDYTHLPSRDTRALPHILKFRNFRCALRLCLCSHSTGIRFHDTT